MGIFSCRELIYKLQPQADFFGNPSNTSKYGLNFLRFFVVMLWQIFPLEIKNSKMESEEYVWKLTKIRYQMFATQLLVFFH